jgi:hypothetical protein
MRGLLALIALFTSVFSLAAMAQSNNSNDPSQKPVVEKRIESVEITEQPKSPTWSKERLQRAIPMPLPKADPDKVK